VRAVRSGAVAMRSPWTVAVLAGVCLAGCGDSTSAPTGVASNPPGQGAVSGTPRGTPSSTGSSGVRTVLSPLGLNIHSTPALSSPHLGTAAEGVVLAVLDHTDQNGGWYKVQGQTVTGWITGDPTLTAPGQFQQFQSTARNFSALYPQDWTFAEETSDTLFHPLSGPQTIVVRGATRVSDFGAGGAPGYLGSGQTTVIVCGVTGSLNEYARTGGAVTTPTPGTAGPLALLAQIRLRLDAAHALALDFNYSAASDLGVFNDLYNSMTFPFPQCQAPAAAAPSPT
jgi:uncharacterized protein YgiM (DUF1202 family)